MADEDAAHHGDGKTDAARAGGQRQDEVDDQRLAHLGLAAGKQDALRTHKSRFHKQAGTAEWLRLPRRVFAV